MSCDTGYSDDIYVSINEVVLAIQAFGVNKASGLDDIYFIVLARDGVLCELCACLACLYMGFYLIIMLAVVLVPIIKDKTGRIDRIDTDQLL